MLQRTLLRRGLVPLLLPAATMAYYRADGVRITHDPFAKGMAEKYGLPGKTDAEGFDPYADSVGAGIYGGTVKRDAAGQVVIGRQYQNHNPRPGPVYSGGGYTPTTKKLSDPDALASWLDEHPDLVNEISTGGATPLHNCGMSSRNQGSVAVLAARGADVEAVDTYGYTPLHRMASNNLAVGAKLLLAAGADPQFKGTSGDTPAAVARSSGASAVLAVLAQHGAARAAVDVTRVVVEGSGVPSVDGAYVTTSATTVPEGFAAVCESHGWPTDKTWQRLNAGKAWFKAPNGAYIYHNELDALWWIDAPDGSGIYKAPGPKHAPPAGGYEVIGAKDGPAPASVRSYRG